MGDNGKNRPAGSPSVMEEGAAPAGPAGGPPEAPQLKDVTSSFLNETLASILSSAQDSVAQMVERARTASDRQVAEAYRLWHGVQQEVARFGSWRDQVDPLLQTLRSRADEVQTRTQEAATGLVEAIRPLSESMAAIQRDMGNLLAALSPPDLVAPQREAPALGGPEGEAKPAAPPPPEAALDAAVREASQQAAREAPAEVPALLRVSSEATAMNFLDDEPGAAAPAAKAAPQAPPARESVPEASGTEPAPGSAQEPDAGDSEGADAPRKDVEYVSKRPEEIDWNDLPSMWTDLPSK